MPPAPPSRTRSKFTIGLIQMRCVPDAAVNLKRAAELLDEATARGVTIACLPELFRTPYFCQVEDPSRFDLAEPIPGPTSEALAAIARKTGMVIVGSVFERRAAGVYHNTATVHEADGSLCGVYRKMHQTSVVSQQCNRVKAKRHNQDKHQYDRGLN